MVYICCSGDWHVKLKPLCGMRFVERAMCIDMAWKGYRTPWVTKELIDEVRGYLIDIVECVSG